MAHQDQLDPQRPTPGLLLWAYQEGIFPMADPESGEIGWYSPELRGVIPLDEFRIRPSLRRVVRQRRFRVTSNAAFAAVISACAEPRDDEDDLSWIDDRIIEAYTDLHELGHAHSIEAWYDRRLVGGLYGVHIGGAFFGESMFSRPQLGGTNASKVCLVHLVEHLRRQGFELLDTQFRNKHLEQFGCVELKRDAYLERLQAAIELPVEWGVWSDA